MKALIVRMAFVLMVVVPAIPASGQGSRDADGRQQIGCFRGRPLPACKTFWIVEMQGSLPVAQTSRTLRFSSDPGRSDSPQFSEVKLPAFDNLLDWNLGHMANLGDRYALGGVVTVGTGNGDGLSGLKVRLRRWLSADLSVEAEAGAAWSNADGTGRLGAPGGSAALRFNIRDQGTFFLRWDVLPLPEESAQWGYHDPGGTQHGLSVGVSAGSVPALIGTGPLGVTMAVLLGVFIAEDS